MLCVRNQILLLRSSPTNSYPQENRSIKRLVKPGLSCFSFERPEGYPFASAISGGRLNWPLRQAKNCPVSFSATPCSKRAPTLAIVPLTVTVAFQSMRVWPSSRAVSCISPANPLHSLAFSPTFDNHLIWLVHLWSCHIQAELGLDRPNTHRDDGFPMLFPQHFQALKTWRTGCHLIHIQKKCQTVWMSESIVCVPGNTICCFPFIRILFGERRQRARYRSLLPHSYFLGGLCCQFALLVASHVEDE